MHDIVLVTTYNRPDYLRLCLDFMSLAEGVKNKEIWICIDRGKSLIREFYEVLNDFRDRLNIFTIVRPEHSYHGNSYNTLEAYKEAYNTNAEFVYLVEDDVLVTHDFFKWNEAVQRSLDCFCSIGYRCSRNSEARRDVTDPSAYFTSARDFASPAICWRRTRLAPVIEHARPEYYEKPKEYLVNRFPNNRFADCFWEQDGMIMRVMDKIRAVTVWSYVPRAYHFGVAGYNRPNGPRLSYEDLKEMIHNPAKIAAADRDFHDIDVMPTAPPASWDAKDLHCLQEFN